MSLERRLKQSEREAEEKEEVEVVKLSVVEHRMVGFLRVAKRILPHPVVALVVGAIIAVTGRGELTWRSWGMLVIVVWLAIDLWAWLMPKRNWHHFKYVFGWTATNAMLIAMMGLMWWWLDGKLADQRDEVNHALAFSYHLPPDQEQYPLATLFSVTNNSTIPISSKNKLVCYINHSVGNDGHQFLRNMWEKIDTYPGSKTLMGAFSGASNTNEFWESMSDATPIEPGGDVQTDNCLAVLGFYKNTVCIDVNVVFLYTLETQPGLRQEKEFRYVGSANGANFSWVPQAYKSKTDFCGPFYKGPIGDGS